MEVKLSRHYRDKGDSVRYTAKGKDDVLRRYDERVCYSAVLGNLGGYEITCLPSGGWNSTPPMTFQRFFRQLSRSGLVPVGVKVGVRKGQNFMVVPRAGWGYHPVFVTLSLYRHADRHGKSIVGRTMYLYDQLRKSGVSFLQCLHWTLVETDFSSWHSCFSVGNTKPYEGGLARALLLKNGLAIAAYGQLTVDEKSALRGHSSTDMFEKLSHQYQDITMKDVDDILNPEYAKYYENPELALK